MRSQNRTRRLKEIFVGLPLAAQFVLALPALIAAGFAVAIGVDLYGEYTETPRTQTLAREFSRSCSVNVDASTLSASSPL